MVIISFEAHFAFCCVPQQFAYETNSRTLFNSTYSTQRSELLVTFCITVTLRKKIVVENDMVVKKIITMFC